MNDDMKKPLKYAEARIVEPFAIEFDGVPSATASILPSAPKFQSSSAGRYVHLHPGQESQNNAVLESRILNDTIRENTRDGKLINLEEDKAVSSLGTAEVVGKRISTEEKRKVVLSGYYDSGVDDFAVRAEPNTNYTVGGTGAHPRVEETVRPTDQFSEYKSEYGEEGYKIPEYKPMY